MTYFPAATDECPTFTDDSDWHPMVDGADYFAELATALTGLGPGDTVQISGLDVDPTIDLRGRAEGDDDYLPLGEMLAAAASRGAQVRVLIAGKVPARSVPLPSLAGFRDSVRHADALRRWRPQGTPAHGPAPLARSVLVDWTGPLTGSNHQKVAVVDRQGVVTAFVCGIDLVPDRFDAAPHERLRLDGDRWGWHDAGVRLRGPAAGRVHQVLALRWREATGLPLRMFPRLRPLRLAPLNPRRPAAAPAPAQPQPPVPAPGTAVRVMRSVPARKVDSVLPPRRRSWDRLPAAGLQEIHETIVSALRAAKRYVYVEDQYLQEYLGGDSEYELYPHLRDAARRGTRVIMVGSGVRDPEDPGVYLHRINRDLNRDLRTKITEPLEGDRVDFAVYRVEHLTVHAKVWLVDDAFACIGSANMFSRSMAGTDSEVSTAVETSGDLVRDLRVRLWAEHLRAPLTPELRASLEDVDLALGIWRPEWLPADAPARSWRQPGVPSGYAPAESVLRAVWPEGADR